MIDTNRLALGIHPNSVLSVAEMVECAVGRDEGLRGNMGCRGAPRLNAASVG